jgi:hypothetical protein
MKENFGEYLPHQQAHFFELDLQPHSAFIPLSSIVKPMQETHPFLFALAYQQGQGTCVQIHYRVYK